MATSPLYLSTVDDLPANARLLRSTYVSCKAYAEQGKTFKANAAAAAFLISVPFTVLGYSGRILLSPLGELLCLRFKSVIPAALQELSDLTTCAAIGTFQVVHLLLSRFTFIANIQANEGRIAAANQRIQILEAAAAQQPSPEQLQAARDQAAQAARAEGDQAGYARGRAEIDQQVNAARQAVEAGIPAQLQAACDQAAQAARQLVEAALPAQLQAARQDGDRVGYNRAQAEAVQRVDAAIQAVNATVPAQVQVAREEAQKAQDKFESQTTELNSLRVLRDQLEKETVHLRALLQDTESTLRVKDATQHEFAVGRAEESMKAKLEAEDAQKRIQELEQQVRLAQAESTLNGPQLGFLQSAASSSVVTNSLPVVQNAVPAQDQEMNQPAAPIQAVQFPKAEMEDEEEQFFKVHQRALQFIFGVVEQFSFCGEWVIKYLDDKCCDGYHTWKDHRYLLSERNYAHFASFHTELTQKFINHQSEDVRTLNVLFDQVQMTVDAQRNKKVDPRTLHKAYHKALRAAKDQFVKKMDQLPPDYRKFVIDKIDNPFAANYYGSYYSKLVSWIAREGKKGELPLSDRPLSDKLKETHAGLKKADPKLLAPPLHILVNKFKAVFSWFDPLMDTNQPSIMGTATYRHASGKTQEVQVTRTPVPVCGRTSPKAQGDQYYEINDIALAPEYVMHLQSLLTEGKNIMVILHLNPKFLGEKNSILDPNWLKDSQTALKKKEAEWIHLFRKLGREYPNQIKVCLYPLDGSFIDYINDPGKTDGPNAFINKLTEFCTKDDSPLKLPSFVHTLDNSQNGARVDEVKLIKHVINEVYKTYFAVNAQGQPIREFGADQRRAFLSLFYSRLSEYERVIHNISWEQRNCKDAWDRTMGLAGPHMADAAKQVNTLQDPATQELIVGQTEGPVLAFGKRPVLHGREVFAQSGMEQIEENPNAKFGPIDLSKTGIERFKNREPVKLEKFDFHPDATQNVLPLPSKAVNASEYNEQLDQLLRTPYALPRGIPLPIKQAGVGLPAELKVLVDGTATDLRTALRLLNLPEDKLVPYFYATDLFKESEELIALQLVNLGQSPMASSRVPIYSFTTKEGQCVGLQIKKDSPLNDTYKAVTTLNVDLKTFNAHFNIEVQKDVPSRSGSPGSPMQIEEAPVGQ